MLRCRRTVQPLLLNYNVRQNERTCLVFLQFEFDPFVDKWQYDDEKVIDIVQKTWAKMSAIGHDHAFKLKMSENHTRLIQLALA